MFKDGTLQNGMVEYNGATYSIKEAVGVVDRITGNTYDYRKELSDAGFKWQGDIKAWITPKKLKWLRANCELWGGKWIPVYSGATKEETLELLRSIVKAETEKTDRVSRFTIDGIAYEVVQLNEVPDSSIRFSHVFYDNMTKEKSFRFIEKAIIRLEVEIND